MLRSPSILAVTDKHHGLGNRVRAVLGSLSLARFEGRGFAYTWPVGKQFGARMNQLWDFEPPVASTLSSRIAALRFPYRNNQLDWLDATARDQRLWQIRTPHALILPPGCPPWEEELRSLRPSAPVQDAILRAYDSGPAGQPYVGVMIRTNANAHQQTLEHSPLSWYVQRMEDIRKWWPAVQFYVAADTTEAFHEVHQYFASCHGTADKGPYNSAQALAASVVDVYMLSAACHVLAPHYSSFPELSQRLAGPELRLETSRTSAESRLVDFAGLSTAHNPLRPHTRNRLG